MSTAAAAPTALIAGEGSLPLEIARRLHAAGDPPLVLTLRKDTEAFGAFARAVVRFSYPGLTKAIKEMRRNGATRLVMAGHISKRFIYTPALFDPLVLKLLTRPRRDDHSLLGDIVKVFEDAGLTVVPYWHILPELLASEGQLGHRLPTALEMNDAEYGAGILKITLPCSFGQSLTVADGAVIAVEAMEGTDEMIKRSGALIRKGTLVKMMRVDQDTRYDLPTVGPLTIENMAQSGLTCLALEASRTLILELEKTLSLAKKHDIALWGLPCQSL